MDRGVQTANELNDESTTLLNRSDASYGAVEANGNSAPAPMPDDYLNRPQVMLLAYCRMVDPVAFFCIVPFINQMIFDLDEYPEADIGFYSGLIVRYPSLMVAMMLT
jgi:hypothetical protein